MVDRNREADRLWSLVVRARGRCERCGQVGVATQAAHIIRRRFLRTRWLPDNGWSLCEPCHYRVDSDPVAFLALVNETVGQVRYEELYRLAHDVRSPRPDRVAVRAGLRALLKGDGA